MPPSRNTLIRRTAPLLGTVVLLVWSVAVPADVLYQWTDENGIRHYTNTRPPKGADAIVLMDEIPYDPEADRQRQAQERAVLQERQDAEVRERAENAEREAEAARRDAEAARREADRLARELETRDDDGAYGIYYPRRYPRLRPAHRPPGQRPPANPQLEDRPPGYPPYDPFPTYPDKPWQQPRQAPERDSSRQRGR